VILFVEHTQLSSTTVIIFKFGSVNNFVERSIVTAKDVLGTHIINSLAQYVSVIVVVQVQTVLLTTL
jgi:hypothetical protein